jgi:hypothetical protein
LSASYAFSPGDVIAFEPEAGEQAPAQKLRADDAFSVSVGDVMELGFRLVS